MQKIDSLVKKAHESWKKGHEKNMLPYLSQAIQLCDEKKEPNRKIELLNEYAGALRCTGHFASAIEAMNRVLTLIQQNFCKNSISYATALMNLGNIYREQHQFEDAKIYFDKSKTLFESLDTNCYEYAGLLNNMSLMHMQLKNYKLAQTLQLQAIEFMKKNDKYLVPLAISYNNLYEIQKNLGQNSLKYLEKAREISENLLSKNHPLYASILNNMAQFHFEHKNYPTACSMYKLALDIVKICYGTDNTSYRSILSNLDYVQNIMLDKKC